MDDFSVAGSWISRKQHALDQESALPQFVGELIVNLLGHHLALAGVQRIGGVRRRRFADGRTQVWLDQHRHIVRPDFLIDLGRFFGIRGDR